MKNPTHAGLWPEYLMRMQASMPHVELLGISHWQGADSSPWKDHLFHLTLKCLKIPQEEMERVSFVMDGWKEGK